MFHAMSCYAFAMFRKAAGQQGGTGHGRARRRLAILSTPVLSVAARSRRKPVEGNDRAHTIRDLIGDPASLPFLVPVIPDLIGDPVSFAFCICSRAISWRFLHYLSLNHRTQRKRVGEKSGLAHTARVRYGKKKGRHEN